jgi:hypothetical protein
MVVAGPFKFIETGFVKQIVHNTLWISLPLEKKWCYRKYQKIYESIQDSVTIVKRIPSADEKLVADLLSCLVGLDSLGAALRGGVVGCVPGTI